LTTLKLEESQLDLFLVDCKKTCPEVFERPTRNSKDILYLCPPVTTCTCIHAGNLQGSPVKLTVHHQPTEVRKRSKTFFNIDADHLLITYPSTLRYLIPLGAVAVQYTAQPKRSGLRSPDRAVIFRPTAGFCTCRL
jgi:hypothetical protein